jgi:hypothetical protein
MAVAGVEAAEAVVAGPEEPEMLLEADEPAASDEQHAAPKQLRRLAKRGSASVNASVEALSKDSEDTADQRDGPDDSGQHLACATRPCVCRRMSVVACPLTIKLS